ncbi:MAG TPA: hypothetical protein VLJ60_12765 [bacterium]|nr:hypothetical protein [bacterium]
MKNIFILFFTLFLSFSMFADQNSKDVLTLKYQAIAVGQVSLAYRLVALSTSLAIAKAVDPEYIASLLDNVDSTISNCKKIVSVNNNSPDAFTVEIFKSIDYLLACSKNVKKYASLQSYENLSSVRECIDESAKIVEKLSEEYNKLSSGKTKKSEPAVPAQK